jgi:hypothetical protein
VHHFLEGGAAVRGIYGIAPRLFSNAFHAGLH